MMIYLSRHLHITMRIAQVDSVLILSTIKDTDMKIVLKVSLREAKRASEAIRDNWHLRKGFNQVETNVWEADSEFWGNLEDEDNVDELKFLVENQFGFLGISEEEYEFNEEEE